MRFNRRCIREVSRFCASAFCNSGHWDRFAKRNIILSFLLLEFSASLLGAAFYVTHRVVATLGWPAKQWSTCAFVLFVRMLSSCLGISAAAGRKVTRMR